jgi:DNA-binding transcriptional MerR regulator
MESNENRTYRISELCDRTGVTKRTVHYYIGRGLLPPAEGAGPASYYTEAHVERILAVRRMQEAYLPLEEIRRRLEEGTDGDFTFRRFDEGATAPAASGPRPGAFAERRLVRILLDHGVELTYPEDDEEAAEIVEKLVRLADRHGKET